MPLNYSYTHSEAQFHLRLGLNIHPNRGCGDSVVPAVTKQSPRVIKAWSCHHFAVCFWAGPYPFLGPRTATRQQGSLLAQVAIRGWVRFALEACHSTCPQCCATSGRCEPEQARRLDKDQCQGEVNI